MPGGGVLASIFGRLFPSAHARRVERWFSDAQRAINALQRRGVDVDALKDDEVFVDFVLDATAAALRTHREEKRRALRNAITNSALPHAPNETKARVFLRLVGELDVHHVLLLQLMADPAGFLDTRGLKFPGPPDNHLIEKDALSQRESPRSLLSLVELVLRDVLPEELDDVVLQDLVRRGLTSETFSALCLPSRSLVSALGDEFVRFIADPPEPRPDQ